MLSASLLELLPKFCRQEAGSGCQDAISDGVNLGTLWTQPWQEDVSEHCSNGRDRCGEMFVPDAAISTYCRRRRVSMSINVHTEIVMRANILHAKRYVLHVRL